MGILHAQGGQAERRCPVWGKACLLSIESIEGLSDLRHVWCVAIVELLHQTGG